jgi:uncharacterized membrane protein
MTLLITLIIVAVAIFVAMKFGKVKDENNNNIPDVIEKPIEIVKEAIAKAKAQEAPVAKKPVAKKPAVKKTNAKKAK